VKKLIWLAAAAAVALAACSSGGSEFPEPSPFPVDVAARLHDIRAKVSEVRGLPPYEKATEGSLTQEALLDYERQQTAKLSQEEKAQMEAWTAALRLLHVIGPEDDLLKLVTEEWGGSVLGMYLPEEKWLVLVGDGKEIGMGDELVLAHEYAHSLQDGAFGFETLDKWAERKTDRSGHTQYTETIDCLTEGDAVVTERLYAEKVYGPDWESLEQEENQTDEEFPDLPVFLLRAFYFNYLECPEFVQGLYDEGGWEVVNAAYKNPPATTEQVLHPEKYKAREIGNGQAPPDLSERLGKGWKHLDTSQFGEFDVYNYAVTMTGDPEAARIAAAGWGGGWLSVYHSKEDASQVVMQLSLSWDSNQDMEEFLVVYGAILQIRGVELQGQEDQPEVRWQAEGEHALLRWNDTTARVDILIATDADALQHVS